MNWFAHRRVTEAQIELLRKLVEEKDKRIALLEQQNTELKSLFSKTSQFEVVEQAEDRLTLKMKPIQSVGMTRGGFRSKRSAMEEQTHSTPNDSVAALEKRVAEGN